MDNGRIKKLTAEHAGQPDKNGQYRVLSTNEILEPECVCTETYLVAGSFNSQMEAENYHAYLKTKFVRYLILQVATTQHISQASFCFVPQQDFTKTWTDQALYEKYRLTEEDISTIETLIKPME